MLIYTFYVQNASRLVYCVLIYIYIICSKSVSPYCYDLGVRDRIIDCLYVYLLDFLYATHDLLFLVQFCYFIRVSCTAVWVAQHVCVYEWAIIYISGIVVANIYCMYMCILLFLYGKVCMVKIKFVLIVWPKWHDKLCVFHAFRYFLCVIYNSNSNSNCNL
jgi:hypothetical protein